MSDVNFSSSYPMQVVSPFLTGRLYNGKVNGIDNWNDDNIDPSEADNLPNTQQNILGDEGIAGEFYTNDPSNKFILFGAIPFPGLEQTKWGFNDLEMRKKNLCALLQSSCTTQFDLNVIIQEMVHLPLPLGAH